VTSNDPPCHDPMAEPPEGTAHIGGPPTVCRDCGKRNEYTNTLCWNCASPRLGLSSETRATLGAPKGGAHESGTRNL
jgi:hypothetical protein